MSASENVPDSRLFAIDLVGFFFQEYSKWGENFPSLNNLITPKGDEIHMLKLAYNTRRFKLPNSHGKSYFLIKLPD